MTFKDALQRAIAAVERWPAGTVRIIHHNDADGLSSGALLTRAFTRQGYAVRRTCLEKPYPKVLEKIFGQQDRLLVFADLPGASHPSCRL